MAKQIALRAQNIPNSGIGTMMRYGAQYTDVISLGQGTPLFPTPQFIYDGVYEDSKTNPASYIFTLDHPEGFSDAINKISN
jgi:hypothetical protein